MRGWSIVFGLLLILPGLLIAQLDEPATASKKKKKPPALDQSYLSTYYSGNVGGGTMTEQVIRLINTGQGGTPLTTPVGDVCANIYVFDNDQEMVACCACRLRPNELASATVGGQLTNNTLTRLAPQAGTISVVPLPATALCAATAPFDSSDASLVAGYSTHLQATGSATFVSETPIPAVSLSPDEANFLSTACLYLTYLGGGQGACNCSVPGT